MSRRKIMVLVGILVLGLGIPVGLVVVLPFLPEKVVDEFLHSGDEFYANYQKIEVGMTPAQVEAILGPGREITPFEVPTTVEEVPRPGVKYEPYAPGVTGRWHGYPIKHVPVVNGDRLFRWDKPGTMTYLIVGFRDGRVSGKYYWEPSL